MPQIPGFNISVLRQKTSTRPSEPLTISGKVSAFGFGFPAFVRVFLEGPQHNPEVRTFDTFASPLSGDYSIPVLAEKEGEYQVYAQAFLPLGVPFPGSPEPLFLGPSIAESTKPPLAIGTPVDGGIEFDLAGQSQRIPLPAPTPIEVSTPITFAPRIEVSQPAPARQPSLAFLPAPVMTAPSIPDAPAAITATPRVGGRIAGLVIE